MALAPPSGNLDTKGDNTLRPRGVRRLLRHIPNNRIVNLLTAKEEPVKPGPLEIEGGQVADANTSDTIPSSEARVSPEIESSNENTVEEQPRVPCSTFGCRSLGKKCNCPTEGRPFLIPEGESLWGRALKKIETDKPDLHEALQKIISHKGESDLTHEAVKEADHALDEVARETSNLQIQKWATPAKVRESHKEAEVRKRLDAIVRYAKLIKDTGKSLLEIDPSGYGKIAWIPFALILELASIELQTYLLAMEMLATLCAMLHKYTEVEKSYAQSSIKRPAFENAVVDLYVDILELEVALGKHFVHKWWIRAAKSIPLLDEWQRRIDDIKEKNARCDGFLDAFKFAHILAIRKGVEKLVEAHDAENIRKTLNWISLDDPTSTRRRIQEETRLDPHFPEHGGWLLNLYKFKKWHEFWNYGVDVFWLHGPVGCGKTCLTTRVIEYWLEKVYRQHSKAIAYFYCSSTSTPSSTVDIMRGLIRQLAWWPEKGQLRPCVEEIWEGRSDHDRLSLQECKELLGELLLVKRQTILIIDAADECENPKELLRTLQSLNVYTKKDRLHLKVFLSSRDDVPVKNYFGGCQSVPISADRVKPDMVNFIKHSIRIGSKDFENMAPRQATELQKRLENLLMEKAGVLFKWVQLQCALFFPKNFTAVNPRDVERMLDELEKNTIKPGDELTQTYQQILHTNTQLGPQARKDLQRVMKWMLASQEPPHISLISDAISNDAGEASATPSAAREAYLRQLTSNLLILNEETRCLEFAHLSVKEFILESDLLDTHEERDCDVHVAADCLKYVVNGGSMESDSEFARHAILSWPNLCAKVGLEGRDKRPLKPYFNQMMMGSSVSDSYSGWAERLQKILGQHGEVSPANDKPPPDPFYLACIHNYPEVVKRVIESRPWLLREARKAGVFSSLPGVQQISNIEVTGLYLAIEHGHLDIAERIIDAVFTADFGPTVLHGPLFAACSHNHIAIAAKLLAKGADPNQEIRHADCTSIIITNGDFCHESARHDGWPCGNHSTSLLEFAIRQRKQQLANLLLDCGARAEGSSNPYSTPLAMTVYAGDVAMVQSLLERKPDLNRVAFHGKSVNILSIALQQSLGEREHLLKILLAAGAHINAKGSTPALWETPLDVVVRHQGSINANDEDETTRSLIAALLTAGALPGSRTTHVRALELARACGWTDIEERLASFDATVLAQLSDELTSSRSKEDIHAQMALELACATPLPQGRLDPFELVLELDTGQKKDLSRAQRLPVVASKRTMPYPVLETKLRTESRVRGVKTGKDGVVRKIRRPCRS